MYGLRSVCFECCECHSCKLKLEVYQQTKNQGGGEKWESADGCSYHDEAGGDRVIAAVAQLPKFGPVVLLAEETSIFFIIPVGQWGAALTTPDGEEETEKDT